MGQKVSPHGLRVGIIKDWDSKWFASKDNFADYLVEDNKIREYVKKKLYAAGVSKVLIERAAESKVRVAVLTGRPGMVIGRSGDGVDQLKADLSKMTGKEVSIDIKEIITFGDNENDNEMLIRSGWGVCLKDGQEITKSVADDITEQTCLEGGVGHYMIDHYLKPNHLM